MAVKRPSLRAQSKNEVCLLSHNSWQLCYNSNLIGQQSLSKCTCSQLQQQLKRKLITSQVERSKQTQYSVVQYSILWYCSLRIFRVTKFSRVNFRVDKFLYKWIYSTKNCQSTIIVSMRVLVHLLLFCLARNCDIRAILIPVIIIAVTLWLSGVIIDRTFAL